MAEWLRHLRTISEAQVQFPRAGCSEREPVCQIFALVPDIALNGCKLHVKPDFNINFLKATQKIKEKQCLTNKGLLQHGNRFNI